MSRQSWQKHDVLFQPTARPGWGRSHAQVPTPDFAADGMLRVYFGSRDGSVGVSLSGLVGAKNPAVDLHARAALADAEAALLAIPQPFTSALTDAPQTVEAAYASVKVLKHVLASEVLGSLGASLKFSDNDGD